MSATNPPNGLCLESVSMTVITAFAAGLPAIVTRPLIEAVRERFSRCCVCALDWLTAARSNIERVEKRLSRLGFIRRLLLRCGASCLLAPSRPEGGASKQLAPHLLCQLRLPPQNMIFHALANF